MVIAAKTDLCPLKIQPDLEIRIVFFFISSTSDYIRESTNELSASFFCSSVILFILSHI